MCFLKCYRLIAGSEAGGRKQRFDWDLHLDQRKIQQADRQCVQQLHVRLGLQPGKSQPNAQPPTWRQVLCQVLHFISHQSCSVPGGKDLVVRQPKIQSH